MIYKGSTWWQYRACVCESVITLILLHHTPSNLVSCAFYTILIFLVLKLKEYLFTCLLFIFIFMSSVCVLCSQCTCTARVTVVILVCVCVCVCVCVSVCLLSHISTLELLFVLKTLSCTRKICGSFSENVLLQRYGPAFYSYRAVGHFLTAQYMCELLQSLQ